MLSRWMTITRQGYNFFTRFCGMKTSENEKWMRERGLMTHDRPTYSHKRKRLLRASDENHFPTEIQIFMLSIRSSWNYYRPITSLSLSLSLVMRMYRKWIRFGRSKIREKTWCFVVYILQTVWNSSCVIIVIGNCV